MRKSHKQDIAILAFANSIDSEDIFLVHERTTSTMKLALKSSMTI